MPATSLAACVLAAVAIGGCTSSANRALDDSTTSNSVPPHGSLTDSEFNSAVAVARAEVAKADATITSATATVGPGTVTDANDGPPCTSGTLLHIKLIGTFPTIAVAGAPTDSESTDSASTDSAPSSSAPSGGFPTDGGSYTVTALLITADAQSGKACLLGVQITPTTPDPGSALLFTK